MRKWISRLSGRNQTRVSGNNSDSSSVHSAQIKLHAPPAAVAEDAAQTIVRERAYNTWLDEVIDEHRRNGGFEQLPGTGKPLELEKDNISGDNAMLFRVMKNANVLPRWLELQHEIRDEIKQILSKVDKQDGAKTTAEIVQLNKKVRRFNQAVPSTLLQKRTLTVEHLHEQVADWE